MGFMDTVKGWFNIGGVKVRLEGIDKVVEKNGTNIKGKVYLTSKSDKTVLKMTYKFIMERSSGRGDEKETEEKVIAKRVLKDLSKSRRAKRRNSISISIMNSATSGKTRAECSEASANWLRLQLPKRTNITS